LHVQLTQFFLQRRARGGLSGIIICPDGDEIRAKGRHTNRQVKLGNSHNLSLP
jgi:hypothetical protein